MYADTHIYIYTHTDTYTHIHRYIHTHTYTYIHTYMHISTQGHTQLRESTRSKTRDNNLNFPSSLWPAEPRTVDCCGEKWAYSSLQQT